MTTAAFRGDGSGETRNPPMSLQAAIESIWERRDTLSAATQGADREARDARDMTALDAARAMNAPDTAALLAEG